MVIEVKLYSNSAEYIVLTEAMKHGVGMNFRGNEFKVDNKRVKVLRLPHSNERTMNDKYINIKVCYFGDRKLWY